MKRPASLRSQSAVMLFLTASLTAPLFGCAATAPSGRAPAGPAIGQALPELPLRDPASGQALSLKSLAGQVVLIDIWASWCGPCKEELPLLDEMAGRLASSGVQILAVSIDEDAEAMNEFLRSKKNWQLRLAHDPLRKVPAQLQPTKMPSSYVVDRTGVLKKIYGGFSRSDLPRLEHELRELAAP